MSCANFICSGAVALGAHRSGMPYRLIFPADGAAAWLRGAFAEHVNEAARDDQLVDGAATGHKLRETVRRRQLRMTSELVALARSEAEYSAARALFAEYASTLGVDLSFQGFTSELTALETIYGPPAGCLLLGRSDGDFVGCIAVRRWSEDSCEMKRLYVRDTARGTGVGRALALAAISNATRMGYRRMLLDTLADMSVARRMYFALGFRECEPYCYNPNAGTMFMELPLGQGRGPASAA